MTHKKQHFIPKSYLLEWCDPGTPSGRTPFVWRFSRDGSTIKRKAPKNIFHETDMYTIEYPDGNRELILEHGLASLEEAFVKIRDSKIKELIPLTADEHFLVCLFISAMQVRTKAYREHIKEQWNQPRKMMEDLTEWSKKASPEEKKRMAQISPLRGDGPRLTYKQVKELSEKPLQKTLFPMIKTLAPLLNRLDFALIISEGEPGFITSDDPCVWFDSEAYKRPPLYRTPALMYETIEITLPISPRLLVLLNRKNLNGPIPISEFLTDELNRRTRFSADEYFIVNKKIKKAIWFDPGVEPNDSWDKVHEK